VAFELTEASYLEIPLGGDRIYFTGAIPGVAEAGDEDGEPAALTWPDRGKRQTRKRQVKLALSGQRAAVTTVQTGRRGPVTIEFPWLPYDLLELFRASNQSSQRGVLHAVHQAGEEDLEVEWLGGIEWQDRPHEYEGDPIQNFQIKLYSHGVAA
jgi:hypothetical protein